MQFGSCAYEIGDHYRLIAQKHAQSFIRSKQCFVHYFFGRFDRDALIGENLRKEISFRRFDGLNCQPSETPSAPTHDDRDSKVFEHQSTWNKAAHASVAITTRSRETPRYLSGR